MLKLKNAIAKYRAVPVATGLVAVAMPITAYAGESGGAGGAGTLSDTLTTFSEVFAWFLKEGGNLLSWMLDKPIILLSLAVFFVGAVVGVLARIYGSF